MTDRKILEIMWKEDSHCYWCGRETIFFGTVAPGFTYPGNGATIDHIYPASGKRPKRKNYPVVLSCNRCNHSRGNRSFEETEKHHNKVDRFFWTKDKINKAKKNQKERKVIYESEVRSLNVGEIFISNKNTPCIFIGKKIHQNQTILVLVTTSGHMLHFSKHKFCKEFTKNNKILLGE
jgi:hypothetical protein